MSAVNWPVVENALQAWIAAAVAPAGIPSTRVIWTMQAGPRPATPWISLKRWGLRPDGIGWVDVEDAPFPFAPIAITGVNTSTSTLQAPAHGLAQGDGPVQIISTNGPSGIPAGLAAATNYWAIPTDADHVQLAASYSDAVAPTPVVVAITSAGSGTLTIVSTADTVKAGQEINHIVRRYYSLTLTIQCYADVTQPTGALEAEALIHECEARALLPSVRNALEAAGCGVYDFGPVFANGEAINTTQFEPRAVVDARIWVVSQISEPDTIIDNVVVTHTNSDVDGTSLPDVLIPIP